MKYRKDGKEMRLALGSYPLVSLANARVKQSEAKALKHKGMDPVHAKQGGKLIAARQADDTFEVIAREWHSKQISNWSEIHAKTVMRRMERDLFPWIGRRVLGHLSWRFGCVVPWPEETQTASDRKPIRFRLANDWDSEHPQRCFINRYLVFHFVLETAENLLS